MKNRDYLAQLMFARYGRNFGRALPKPEKGYLGLSDGTIVSDRPNHVWVRTMLGPQEVFNDQILHVFNTPCWIGFTVLDPWHKRILAPNDIYESPIPAQNPNIAEALGPTGANPLWLTPQMFIPWLPRPVLGTLTLRIETQAYWALAAGWVKPQTVLKDLTPNVPATGARWVLIYADASGAIATVDGTSVATKNSLTEADIPDLPANGLPIVAVQLAAGQTEMVYSTYASDLLDLRFGGVASWTSVPVNYETSAANLKMDGTAAVGTLETLPRADHVHPTDTSRQPLDATLTSLATLGVMIGDLVGPDFISTRSGSITRDASGLIQTISKTGGRTLIITRNTDNQITSISDGSRTWTFTRSSGILSSWSVA